MTLFSDQEIDSKSNETIQIEEGDEITVPIPRKFHFRSSESEDTIYRTVEVGEELVNNRVDDYIDTSLENRDRFDTSQFAGEYRLSEDGTKAKRQ